MPRTSALPEATLVGVLTARSGHRPNPPTERRNGWGSGQLPVCWIDPDSGLSYSRKSKSSCSERSRRASRLSATVRDDVPGSLYPPSPPRLQPARKKATERAT